MAAAGAAVVVTLVATLGGAGVLTSDPASAERTHGQGPTSGRSAEAAALAGSDTRSSGSSTGHPRNGDDASRSQTSPPAASSPSSAKPRVDTNQAPGVPVDSGTGRRVVFDMSDQRVWLVTPRAGGDVALRTYLVSGSVTDNLAPGTYSVYSKSLQAWGVDDSGSMRYMVRFAHGSRAAIGFHDIPVLDGELVQTRDDLGTPQSHGCIRQWRSDARALWRFAPRGTTVVVTA
jgi:lipoprotein-anchoring transpeptidase ErfK/SrfK